MDYNKVQIWQRAYAASIAAGWRIDAAATANKAVKDFVEAKQAGCFSPIDFYKEENPNGNN